MQNAALAEGIPLALVLQNLAQCVSQTDPLRAFMAQVGRPRIVCDIDGTLAFRDLAVLAALWAEFDLDYSWSDMTEIEGGWIKDDKARKWYKKHHHDPQFLSTLAPDNAAKWALHSLRDGGYSIIVASDRDASLGELSMRWLDQWGFKYDEVRIGNGEKLRMAREATAEQPVVFFDDSPERAADLPGPGVLIFLLDRPWNQGVAETEGLIRVRAWPEILARLPAMAPGDVVKLRRTEILKQKGPKAAGIAVQAQDTGRVLLVQRKLDDPHAGAGKWEFPGGTLDEGESAIDAAKREWAEEVGQKLPAGSLVGSWQSDDGVYQGFVWVIPHESSVETPAPGIDTSELENLAWFTPDQLEAMPDLRGKVRDNTDWDLVTGKAADPDLVKGVEWDEGQHPRDEHGHFVVSGNQQARDIVDRHLQGKHDGMTQRSKATHAAIVRELHDAGLHDHAARYEKEVAFAKQNGGFIHPREALGRANQDIHIAGGGTPMVGRTPEPEPKPTGIRLSTESEGRLAQVGQRVGHVAAGDRSFQSGVAATYNSLRQDGLSHAQAISLITERWQQGGHNYTTTAPSEFSSPEHFVGSVVRNQNPDGTDLSRFGTASVLAVGTTPAHDAEAVGLHVPIANSEMPEHLDAGNFPEWARPELMRVQALIQRDGMLFPTITPEIEQEHLAAVQAVGSRIMEQMSLERLDATTSVPGRLAALRSALGAIRPMSSSDQLKEVRGVGKTGRPLASGKPVKAALEGVQHATQFYPAGWLERTGGKIGIGVDNTRGSALEDRVYVPSRSDPRRGSRDRFSTATHELGHYFENRGPKAISRSERAFFEKRTGGEKGASLRSLTGIPSYGPMEVAKADQFANPYMGKIYGNSRNYELLTMGMEHLRDGSVDAPLAHDHDYMSWLLGTLATA